MITLYTLNQKLVRVGSKFFGIITEPTPPGPTFEEVTIGTQTWMAKNLAIDDGQGGIYTQTVNYGQGDVTEYYYTWDAAVRIAASITGWHIPSRAEFDILASSVGGTSVAGNKLKSSYGWSSGNGTDDYGFSAFPAGLRSSIGRGGYQKVLSEAEFLTTDISSRGKPYTKGFGTGSSMSSSIRNKDYAFSVRLIKDT